MPFSFFRGKKKEKYTLSQKNSCLLKVKLLDGNHTECSVTAESTGRDCINTALSKNNIDEVEFFGLKYNLKNKNKEYRWIDLDKPIKKHLDKYSSDSVVILGIIFYVPSINYIKQEVTRYFYYLQVREDIITGKISCSDKDIIELTSLFLQADNGSYNPTTHNLAYIIDINDTNLLIPKNYSETKNESQMKIIYANILERYKSKLNLPTSDAELQYIQYTMLLPSFSQQMYCRYAKSTNKVSGVGLTVSIGTSCKGIIVISPDAGPDGVETFLWDEYNSSVKGNILTLEAPLLNKTRQFTTNDSENAKYMGKVFSLYKKFHEKLKLQEDMEVQESDSENLNSATNNTNGINGHSKKKSKITRRPTLRKNRDSDAESSASIKMREVNNQSEETELRNGHMIDSQYNLYSSQSSLDPTSAYMSSHSSLNKYHNSQMANNGSMYHGSRRTSQNLVGNSYLSLSNQSHRNSLVASSASINSHQDYNGMPLPPYQKCPDYNMAVRARRRQSTNFEHSGGNHSGGSSHSGQIGVNSNLIHNNNLPSSNSLANHKLISNEGPVIIRNAHQPQVRQRPHSMISSRGDYSNHCNIAYIKNPTVTRHQSQLFNDRRKSLHFSDYGAARAVKATSNEGNLLVSESAENYNIAGSTPALADQHSMLPTSSQLPHSASAHVLHSAAGASTPNLIVKDFRPLGVHQAYHHLPHYNNNSVRVAKSSRVMLPKTQLCTLQSYNEDEINNNDLSELFLRSKNTDASREMLFENSTSRQSFETNDNMPDSNINNAKVHLRNRIDQHGKNVNARFTPTKSPALPQSSLLYNNHNNDRENQEVRLEGSPYKENVVHHLKTPINEMKQCFYVGDDEGVSENGDINVMENRGLQELRIQNDMANLNCNNHKNNRNSVITSNESEIIQCETMDKGCIIKYDERVVELERIINSGNLHTEYDKIPKMMSEIVEQQHIISTRSTGIDRFRPYKNNYLTVDPSENNPSGYVNASKIQAEMCGSAFSYIACQNTMRHYERDTWNLAWKNNISVIVLLSNEDEPGRALVSRYWPNCEPGASESYGEFKVTTRQVDVTEVGVTRSLQLQRNNEIRDVIMFHYTAWPNTGVPSNPSHFVGFMDDFKSIRRQSPVYTRNSQNSNYEPKIMVQCSTGSGRSGVFILLEVLMFAVEHGGLTLEKPTTLQVLLEHFRTQRMGFVSNFSQYVFVYKCLVCFLKSSRLI